MKRFLMFLCAVTLALVLVGNANAVLVNFDNDAVGPKANGWVSNDSDLLHFSDSNGSGLKVLNAGNQTHGNAITCYNDYDDSYLIMDFDIYVGYLAFDFGNDDPEWIKKGNVVLELYRDGTFVDQATMAMNVNDIMDQTMIYTGATFNRATIYYDVVGRGLIEAIDDINFEAVPEPSTILLMGIGLLGLLGYSRKRSQKS
jgi:hypothetical protein